MYTVVNDKGYIVDYCVDDNFECKTDTKKVTRYTGFNTDKFIKPRWDGINWVEGATETEINSKQEVEIVPSQEEIMIQLIKENAEMKTQIAEITLELAEIKGGK